MSSFSKSFTRLFKLIVTLLVMAFLVRKLGWNQILATVLDADPLWLVASVAVFIASGWLG